MLRCLRLCSMRGTQSISFDDFRRRSGFERAFALPEHEAREKLSNNLAHAMRLTQAEAA